MARKETAKKKQPIVRTKPAGARAFSITKAPAPLPPQEATVILPKLPKNAPQLVRGFKDILSDDQKYWEVVRAEVRRMGDEYGFSRIDLPTVEDTSLFVRAVGKESDIVEKEMFSWVDRGDEKLSLRPEATAQIARAYLNHGMLALPQPVRLYYIGPMFRYERPQAGRHRQFHQFGFEVVGEAHPVLDAQLIIIAYNFFKKFGVETSIQINSIGTPESRKVYRTHLVNYYKTQKADLCDDCKQRLTKNPLRLLDCKNEKCQAIKEDAPQIVDFLDDESKNHFVKVLEYLDELGIPYNLNPYLVRGLDYYTKTVFEILPAGVEQKAQSALGGGGRYDNLIGMFSGRPVPAVGFAIGIERAIARMKETNYQPPALYTPEVFVAQLGDAAKRKCLKLFEELRADNIRVASSFSKDDLKNQLSIAAKLGVRYTLIMGQKELSEGTILLRDMDGGMQETIAFNKIAKELKKRLTV